MDHKVRPWQLVLAVFGGGALVSGIGSRAQRPAPIRSQAPAGANPIHYTVEFGPPLGLLEEMKQAGRVPPDAMDDGNGHFVSPSRLSPDQRALAARIVEARERRRAARTR